MTYIKHPWADGPDGGTPITAAWLNHMEDGIADAVSPEQLDEAVNTLVATDTVLAGDLSNAQSQLATIGPGLSSVQADLNTASASTVASALVRRNSSGQIEVARAYATQYPVSTTELTRKDYVDTAISTAVAGISAVVDYSTIPAGSTITVIKTTSWPARPTARADIIVAWKGPDPSPSVVSSGTGGMRDGIDYRLVTP